jgi:hypothetical protein
MALPVLAARRGEPARRLPLMVAVLLPLPPLEGPVGEFDAPPQAAMTSAASRITDTLRDFIIALLTYYAGWGAAIGMPTSAKTLNYSYILTYSHWRIFSRVISADVVVEVTSDCFTVREAQYGRLH